MEVLSNKTPVIAKTEELCQTILDQPSFQDIQGKLTAFEGDTEAQRLYSGLADMQDQLQAKQQRGEQLADAEIDAFEKARDTLLNNDTAREFLDAQQALHKMTETIKQYVSKTISLGRVPVEDDFKTGGCGPNCGCSGKG